MRRDKTLFYCPICQARLVRMPNTGDYVHDCGEDPQNDNLALKQEDVLILGDAVDYTGSIVAQNNAPLMGGVQNRLWGQRADVEGVHFQGVTKRGAGKFTHRQRGRLVHIDFNDQEKKK